MADQVVQEIKDRLNIADVIGGYLQLKKAGVNFRALCPFHNERTPSFNVSPQRQIWHCFGCGEGGDIFGFVMRYENLDFREALKILAQKAGVELPQYRPKDPKQQEEKDLLYRINDYAARLYHQVLLKDEKASAYLKERGLALETIKQWQIGFAPEGFNFLHHSLLKKDIKEDQMVKAGVLVAGEKNNFYDRFRGRIMFPIFDYFGAVIGFSARILFDDGKSAKYLNSPENEIYNKSRTLFGLNFAKDAIRKKDEAVIVEGQMDCISLHQAGFTNVVASSGTALTEKQLVEKQNPEQEKNLTQLGRLTKNIKFCFDSDSAGQIAGRRAGEMALRQGFRVKFIVLKDVKDPDELVKKNPGLWAKAVSEAVWFLDFYINSAKDKFPNDPVEQKHYLSKEVVPFLGLIFDPLEQDHYINQMAKQFGVSERVIREQIKGKTASNLNKSQLEPSSFGVGGTLVLEKEVLGGLLTYKVFLEQVRVDLAAEDFDNLEIRQAALAAASVKSDNAAQESALAKEASFMVESLLEQLGPKAFLKRLLKSYSQLKVNNLKKKQKILQNEIYRAENLGDKVLLRKLQEDFVQVSQLKMEWEKRY